MAEHAEDTRVKDALELLNSYARDKKSELQDMLTGKYSNLKSTVSNVGARLQQDAGEIYAAGKEKTVRLAKDLDKNVHENPWPYIGGTALGALIVGYLLGRSQK